MTLLNFERPVTKSIINLVCLLIEFAGLAWSNIFEDDVCQEAHQLIPTSEQ